jgi:histidyl-tRNA synthetase
MVMIRGTRIIEGVEAKVFSSALTEMRRELETAGYGEIILPALADPELWTTRSGSEIENQMWLFGDKATPPRPTCLIPEATALIQNLYDESWEKSRPKPIRLFYVTRCYRYERPQAGRYREFTQFGCEILGPSPESYEDETKKMLKLCLEAAGVDYDFDDEVTRGLSYYSRQGFEARVESLGAQKQIAGGGTYKQGCGWAIGVDRLVLALGKQNNLW